MIARTARHVALAVQFYTRLPVHGRLAAWVGFRPEMLRGATGHLPLVGWLVGGAAAGTAVVVGTWWPPAVVAVACTVVTVALTGAFHEDGLADTADALGGHVDRDRALQIMTDSRLGTYGVLALVLVLAAKLAALASLAGDPGAVVVALLAAHVLSRTCPLLVMRVLPYVGSAAGKAKPMADRTTGGALTTALLQAAPAVALLVLACGPVRAAVVVTVLAAVAVLAVQRLRRRLGGFTGDTLGATQQVGELGVYLVLVA